MNKKLIIIHTGIAVLGLSVSIFAGQAAKSLYINGKVASTSVSNVVGVSVVPVRDVANALGAKVTNRPDGALEILVEGRAGEEQAKLAGKVGDWLFDGSWRFNVDSVERVEQFETEYYRPGTKVKARNAKEELILIRFRLRNGMKIAGSASLNGNLTAIALEDGSSIRFGGGDMKYNIGWASTPTILPGAEHRGLLWAYIRKDEKEKDVIFNYDYSTTYERGNKPKEATVMRISLR
jgi:acylphosphatase